MTGYLDRLLSHARQAPTGVRPRQPQPFEEGGFEMAADEPFARLPLLSPQPAEAPASRSAPRQAEPPAPSPARVQAEASGPRDPGRREPVGATATRPAAAETLVTASVRRPVPEEGRPAAPDTQQADFQAEPLAVPARRSVPSISPAHHPEVSVSTPERDWQAQRAEALDAPRVPAKATRPLPAPDGVVIPAPAAAQPARDFLPPAGRPASSGASRRGERRQESPAPTIEIHIGRVEVRAVPPVRAEKAVRPSPALSLDAYLNRDRP